MAGSQGALGRIVKKTARPINIGKTEGNKMKRRGNNMNMFGARLAQKQMLMIGASVLVLASGGAAFGQAAAPDAVEQVTVTGSRVLTDSLQAPTPITIVSAAQLEQTTPTNISDGLNKLPVFQGSQSIGQPGGGGTNTASNVLNLRNFGANRTLVMMDAHRVTPSNADGTVDIDSLPQMLISRVDIVTGGASAVYGSDAVSGVVNFILDKKFDGVKINANGGISTYGDAATYKVEAAAGSDLFGGRGHIEGSVEYRNSDPLNVFARPYGPLSTLQSGNGTAANPFTTILNGRRPNSTAGGLIQSCVPACPAANMMNFVGNGVLAPFNPGQTTGTANQNSGGDGAFTPYATALSASRQAVAFGRFSYDVDDSTTFYVQGTASEAYDKGWHFPQKLTPGSGQADVFYKNNPYLPASVQTLLLNNGTNPVANPATTTQPSNTFQLGEFLQSQGQSSLNGATGINRTLSVQTGLDGTLLDGRFSWDAFYTHGENRLAENLLNNQNYQKLFAAEDAVLTPGGTVACYAATQAATAAAYADCVPLNPFGPSAVTASAFNYTKALTYFHQTNILDDLGAGISGKVLDGWAGPITAALSAEGRFNDYAVTTNVPVTTINCAGLRLCNSALPLFAQNVLAPVTASSSVWEVAGEAEIPLLKDLPFVKSLDANIAGRYTDYSTSGAVQTWKLGLVYTVDDQLRFRGTSSIDIRAPTLSDLNQPATLAVGGFTDLHTSFSSTTFTSTQGNQNLVPEVARTYTVGAVWTPEFVSNLSVSLDYFRIHMNNSIGAITASSTTIQNLCEASNGASIYCSLYQRPLPFSDHTQANYPTRIFNQSLNTALNQTEGFDFETNYAFEMSDLISDWAGSWSTRVLASYQPVNEQITFPGSPESRTTAPKTRVTAFLNYTLRDWSLGLEDRWIGGYSQVATAGQVYATPYVHSFNSLDANVQRKFDINGSDVTAYLTVQNIANSSPALLGTSSLGEYYPTPGGNGNGIGESFMGRYFTIGLKANL
jgi:outer membrane receptor protein involved in Fe transport